MTTINYDYKKTFDHFVANAALLHPRMDNDFAVFRGWLWLEASQQALFTMPTFVTFGGVGKGFSLDARRNGVFSFRPFAEDLAKFSGITLMQDDNGYISAQGKNFKGLTDSDFTDARSKVERFALTFFCCNIPIITAPSLDSCKEIVRNVPPYLYLLDDLHKGKKTAQELEAIDESVFVSVFD